MFLMFAMGLDEIGIEYTSAEMLHNCSVWNDKSKCDSYSFSYSNL